MDTRFGPVPDRGFRPGDRSLSRSQPRHDDPHRHTAYDEGRDTFIRGGKFDPFRFMDQYRQDRYEKGYNDESRDHMTRPTLDRV